MNPIVLIVDDELSGREAIESILITQNYNLIFAEDGFEALTKARELMPDMILLDVMMPDLDGFEVCRQLRADARVAEVPVVMVTALDDRDSRLQGLEAGADDFITKPIDRAELRARVKTITRLNRYRSLQEERAKLECQLDRLMALRTIDLAITSSHELQDSLSIVLQQATARLGIDAAAILRFDPYAQILQFTAGRGFHDGRIKNSRLRISEDHAGRAVRERRMICVPDLAACVDEFVRADLLKAEKFQTYYGVPLLAKGKVEGVLEIFHRTSLHPDREWLDFLSALGEQAAIAIDNAQLFEDLQQSNANLIQAYDATIEGWSRALDLRDKETEGHSRRVTDTTLQLARQAGMSEAQLIQVRRGALLHDIGKLGVPDGILFKPGPLTDEEWAIMHKHPVYAYELLSPIAYLRPALDIPYCHHEKWDGTGYPNGLKGERIPLAARIFAVVDVWDALRSDRPYRPSWPEERVQAYIKSEAGKHFDPHAVELFLSKVF